MSFCVKSSAYNHHLRMSIILTNNHVIMTQIVDNFKTWRMHQINFLPIKWPYIFSDGIVSRHMLIMTVLNIILPTKIAALIAIRSSDEESWFILAYSIDARHWYVITPTTSLLINSHDCRCHFWRWRYILYLFIMYYGILFPRGWATNLIDTLYKITLVQRNSLTLL